MHLSNPPPEALHQLERHKAALFYHQQRLISSPTPQVQQTSNQSLEERQRPQKHISPDLPLSMGNMFQDGITQLPVMYLPKHHHLRIQRLRALRLQGLQSPTSQKQEANENGRAGGNMQREENQTPKIGIKCSKTLIAISNSRKFLRKKLHDFRAHKSPAKISRETAERRQRELIVKNTRAKPVEMQLHHPIDPSKHVIEEGDVEVKEPIEMAVELDAIPLPTSDISPGWPLRPSIESVAWI